jgi:hypothetical protein
MSAIGVCENVGYQPTAALLVGLGPIVTKYVPGLKIRPENNVTMAPQLPVEQIGKSAGTVNWV